MYYKFGITVRIDYVNKSTPTCHTWEFFFQEIINEKSTRNEITIRKYGKMRKFHCQKISISIDLKFVEKSLYLGNEILKVLQLKVPVL